MLTNNGRGVFGFKGQVNLGYSSDWVIAADINNDGRPDLIAQGGGTTAMVYTNNGSGIFGSNATLTAGINVIGGATADVNGDGKPDIIIASYSWLTIFTNNGSGHLGLNNTINVGGNPHFISAADLNGDGMPDLVTVNLGDSSLTVFYSDGNGGYNFNSTRLYLGDYPSSVLAADVNRDGKLDLISTFYNTITVLLNNSVSQPPTNNPKTTVKIKGKNLRVAWPSISPGWSLQENPDLTKTSWLPSGYGGYPIADDGTNKSLTLPRQNGNLFFRLIHP